MARNAAVDRSRIGRWFFAGLLLATPAPAADHVWLIGGGPEPQSSEVQIEQNVLWASRVLAAAPGKRALHLYFTDGAAPGRDVKLWSPAPETRAALQPLARVYGSHELNGERYRSHQIKNVSGGTEAGALREQLAREFSALHPGDRAFIVFNGHGQHHPADPAGNTVQLWNNTTLDVREFEALLVRIDARVPVRFLFTQCYAGAFARLVHPLAKDTLELAAGERCGFLAEGPDRPAEGCSAAINSDDYRDYSTYFFAALSGRTRRGERLPNDPDRDRDGRVSLYEAHLYALRNAHSNDLPRSTSEDFLERWHPRALDWSLALESAHGARPEDNPYFVLAAEVTQALGIVGTPAQIAQAIRRRVDAYRARQKALDQEQAGLEREIQAVQAEIQQALEWRWPEAGMPYTGAHRRFLQQDLAAAQEFILAHARYPELVARQTRHAELNDELLANERDQTQMEKVERLQKLGRLRSRFDRHASAATQAGYRRLLACERQPL